MTLIYYGLCAFSVIFGWCAQRKESKLYFWISALCVCCIVGFRAKSVGIDTTTYYTYIDWAARGILKLNDVGFLVLTKLLLKINKAPEFVVAVFSILTVLFIFGRFWSMRDRLSYPMMQFIYLAFYLQLSMNIMRQFLAISIVFFATILLERRRYIWYLLINIIAVTIHSATILGFIILFLYYLFNERNFGKKIFFMFFSLCLVPIAISFVLNRYLALIDMYFKNTNVNIGMMMIAKMGLLILFVVTQYRNYLSGNQEWTFHKIIVSIYFVGIMFTSLGYVFPYMERTGLVFMMFEPVCLSMMCKKHVNSKFFVPIILALCVFLINKNYIANSNGVFPYLWFFRN